MRGSDVRITVAAPIKSNSNAEMASFGQPLKSFWVTLRVRGDGSSRSATLARNAVARISRVARRYAPDQSLGSVQQGWCLHRSDGELFFADFAAPKSVSSTGLTANVSGIMHGMAWHEDHRRVSKGAQFSAIAVPALISPVNREWCSYWRRSCMIARKDF